MIIVAAGQSRRFLDAVPKVYHHLADRPVLAHSIAAFQAAPEINAIQVVIRPEDQEHYEKTLNFVPADKLLTPVYGGTTRQASVFNGLQALADLSPSFVLIHDGARPFVSQDLIGRMLESLKQFPAAIPALPASDTLKRAKPGRGLEVAETLNRQEIWLAQTPQAFHYTEIMKAHQQGRDLEATDDAALCEAAGIPVGIMEGEKQNIKITTQDDLVMNTKISAPTIRTGIGFDVHAFAPGDHLMLCGLKIPFDKKLDGHSDADVALHAVTDALLGACAMGDIGMHFPPDDDTYKNIDSAILLENAATLMREQGWGINNIDLTIICEKPKIGPYRMDMSQRLAEILHLLPQQVSVKATTTEKLGFTGREEGIAAQAIVTVRAL